MYCHAEGCDRLLLTEGDRFRCDQCQETYCIAHIVRETVDPVWDNPRKAQGKRRLLYYSALCPKHAAEWHPD